MQFLCWLFRSKLYGLLAYSCFAHDIWCIVTQCTRCVIMLTMKIDDFICDCLWPCVISFQCELEQEVLKTVKTLTSRRSSDRLRPAASAEMSDESRVKDLILVWESTQISFTFSLSVTIIVLFVTHFGTTKFEVICHKACDGWGIAAGSDKRFASTRKAL